MTAKRANVTGAAGAVPPPHAPREVSQPLQPGVIEAQLAAARANERPLPPFDPPMQRLTPTTSPAPAVHETPPGAETTSLQSLVDDVFGADTSAAPSIILTDADQPRREDAPHTALPVQAFPDTVKGAQTPTGTVHEAPMGHQPAASNSDSPSRGIPRAVDDPGKVITGGFGEALDAQYFPLDGTELRNLLIEQMEQIAVRLENDLRFSIAVTYPRVRATVKIEVEGYSLDVPIEIQKEIAHRKTPVEVAEAKGAVPVAFDIVESTQEMTKDGQHETAPNEIREHLGMAIPRKQAVDSGAGRMIVDVRT